MIANTSIGTAILCLCYTYIGTHYHSSLIVLKLFWPQELIVIPVSINTQLQNFYIMFISPLTPPQHFSKGTELSWVMLCNWSQCVDGEYVCKYVRKIAHMHCITNFVIGYMVHNPMVGCSWWLLQHHRSSYFTQWLTWNRCVTLPVMSCCTTAITDIYREKGHGKEREGKDRKKGKLTE